MGKLTDTLATPSPSKRILDPGRLADPAMAVLGAAETAVGAGFSLLDHKNKQKAAAEQRERQARSDARADRSDARAERADERAQVRFEQDQADRELKLSEMQAGIRSKSMEDELARAVYELNKVQSGVEQGGNSSMYDLRMEATVDRLMAKYPDQPAEIMKYLSDNGHDHLLTRHYDAMTQQNEFERNTRQSADQDAYNKAVKTGAASSNQSWGEVVSTGYDIQAVESAIKVEQDKFDLMMKEAKFDREQQEFVTKTHEREMSRLSSQAAEKTGSFIFRRAMSDLGAIQSDEEWSEFVKKSPAIFSQLEESRMNLLSMAEGNESSMTQINKVFDRYIGTLEDFTTGDLSYAKQRADVLSNIQREFQLNSYEMFPALSQLDYFPKSLLDSFKNTPEFQIGAVLDPAIKKGLTDALNNYDTEEAREFFLAQSFSKQIFDPRVDNPYFGEGSDSVSLQEAKAAFPIVSSSVEASKAFLLSPAATTISPETKAEYETDFIQGYTELLGYMSRLSTPSNNNFSAHSNAVDSLMAPENRVLLDSLRSNPAYETLVDKTDQMALRVALDSFENIKDHVRTDSDFNTKFDVNSGQFVLEFDKKRHRERLAQSGAYYGYGSTIRAYQHDRAGGNYGYDSAIRAYQHVDPPERLTKQINTMNTLVDFMSKTWVQTNPDMKRATPSSIKKALATGDYSGLVDATGNSLLHQTVVDPDKNPQDYRITNMSSLTQSSQFKIENSKVGTALDQAADKYGVPPALLHAMADVESGGKQNAKSHVGAKGVMQLMPATAKDLGVDPDNMEDNVNGGAMYLGRLIKMFDGNIYDAIMAYNAGPGRISRWVENGRPVDDKQKWQNETFPYVEKIQDRLTSPLIKEDEEDVQETDDSD